MTDAERKDLIVYRIGRAKDTLKEVNLHVDNELLSTTVNRLYYACYYAVIALLVAKKLMPKLMPGLGKCLDHILLNRD